MYGDDSKEHCLSLMTSNNAEIVALGKKLQHSCLTQASIVKSMKQDMIDKAVASGKAARVAETSITHKALAAKFQGCAGGKDSLDKERNIRCLTEIGDVFDNNKKLLTRAMVMLQKHGSECLINQGFKVEKLLNALGENSWGDLDELLSCIDWQLQSGHVPDASNISGPLLGEELAKHKWAWFIFAFAESNSCVLLMKHTDHMFFQN